MDLYEYQGKQYFARFGIPTSTGSICDTVEEAVDDVRVADVDDEEHGRAGESITARL